MSRDRLTFRAGLAAFAVLGLLACPQARAGDGDALGVLILSGANNHDWKTTTPALRQTLEDSGLFKVDVTEDPGSLKPDAFKNYDVLISNWNTYGQKEPRTWDKPTRDAFLKWIEKGGGFVVVHAGGTMYFDWPEYHKLIGATWGKGTGHGPKHEFKVEIAKEDHPITRGVENFKTFDELWHNMAVNGEIEVLATARSDRTKKAEPMAFVTHYGKGRCFNLVLGHDARAIRNEGFARLLTRGTRWAATGKVDDAQGADVDGELSPKSLSAYLALRYRVMIHCPADPAAVQQAYEAYIEDPNR